MSSSRSVRISELTIFPVKGMRGLRKDFVELTPQGFRHDRRFMIIDASGRFISQRTHRSLAQLRLTEEPSTGRIRVEAPDGKEASFPLEPQWDGPDQPEPMDVVIWDDIVSAWAGFPDMDALLSDFLEDDLRLVWMPESTFRALDPAYGGPEDQVSFADGYPILILGQSSVDELNTRLMHPVPANRFRANMLVTGTDPWEEDGLTRVAGPDAALRVVKRCKRCVVITLDQESGEASPEKEPTATLATYRRWDGGIAVGMNAIPEPELGSFRVGDVLDVTHAQERA